jgi:hypothetical protein
MSQCASIWAWMADGHTITPKEAYEKFGTLALHSRIAELRERGHEIHTEMITVNGKQVGRYSLISEPESRAA